MRMAAACLAAVALPAIAGSPTKKHGLIVAGVGHHGRRVKCHVNGVDLTNVCFAANDVEGWADCFKWEGYPNPPGDKPKRIMVVSGRERSLIPSPDGHFHAWVDRRTPDRVRLVGDVKLSVTYT